MSEEDKNVPSTEVVQYEKEVSRNRYFDYISHDIDSYANVAFSQEEAANIAKYLRKVSTGSASLIPMTCSDSCFARFRCPLFQIAKHPVGKQCLIESQLLKEWVIRYMEEYNVDPMNFTEVGYCNELSEIEVLQLRLNIALARPENAELIIEQSMGVDRSGNTITQKQISPYLEQKQTLTRRKSQIIKLMVGDRQEKYKREAALKQKPDTDTSSQMSAIKQQLQQLQNKLRDNNKVLEAEVLSPEELMGQSQEK